MSIRLKKLRDSANGQDCTVNVAGVCNYSPETTVLAHFNFEGGAMGSKSDDTSAGFACSACHDCLDNNRLSDEDALFYKGRSMMRTVRFWVREGYLR